MTDLVDLSEREKWVLRLLYAPQKRGQETSIEGRTRLVKGLFLIDRMLSNKFPDFYGTGFEFRPYKYGPFDQSIYEAVEQLEERGLVTKEPSPEYSGNEFNLTVRGETVSKKAFEELPPKYKKEISWIKGKHVQKPVGQLLSFVYNQYPEMAQQSEYTS